MQENNPTQQAPDTEPQQDAAAEPQSSHTDTMPSLQEALRAAELKAEEHHDAWLRAKAETENLRRRAQEDVEKAHKYAGEKFAQAMLPVKDSLEAALNAENASFENLRDGVELTLKQLASAFEGAGVEMVDPVGEKFDPNVHQAISAQPDDGEPNRVLTVLQKGYTLHGRVIRPALVIVSAAKG
ncbi:nucleotide exchange factor GrpE [Nitrogeniibacter mangrovi]|uniref:Protein GrpE n=1 Tax=Nitrogeniibacter mangrovi TaxID=2016596 RepID=A0A6C1B576_9RHOO|nr:nucleotide exchange factor GrpE [Nitrogeniibacter mangrovi]QID18169.1 nucleotide exchange factor GrpE [Nitrogeniibacter mangrovi]